MSQPRILLVVGAYPDVGKGVFSASLGYLLQERGYSVRPVKFDGHFNTSQGSIFPYHDQLSGGGYFGEEVFVTKDGYLSGIDTSNYEKFLHLQLDNRHNITTGRLFEQFVENERQGKYARMVINYRHLRTMLTDWILGEARDDILILEGGGSVGDRELELLFEAMSEVKSTGAAEVRTILLSPYLWKETGAAMMSYKSKITRQAFEKAWRQGVRPDIIVLRTSADVSPSAVDRGYIAFEARLDAEADLFINPDQDNLYSLPDVLHEQGLDRRVLSGFGLSERGSATGRIESYSRRLDQCRKADRVLRIGLFGNNASFDSFASLLNAVENAGVAGDIRTETVWLDEQGGDRIDYDRLGAIVLGEGIGKIEARYALLKAARERGIPCLALAFGFDLFIKEYARTLLGAEVAIEELGEDGDLKLATCAMKTGGVALSFRDRSIQWSEGVDERVRTNSTLSSALRDLIDSSELEVLASDRATGEPMALRVPDHPFLVAVKYHPEYLSHPGHPHPLFVKLLAAASARPAA